MPQIEVQITLSIEVPDSTATAYYVEATGVATTALIADLFDILPDVVSDPITKINGYSHSEIKAKLAQNVP